MKDSMNIKTHEHSHHQHDHKKQYVDPVCGMASEQKDQFVRHEHNGRSYYFCSDHCLNKFKTDPVSYTDRTSGSKPTKDKGPGEGCGERRYTCPMHPEVEQEGPGDPARSAAWPLSP